jgi:hypothetical protein
MARRMISNKPFNDVTATANSTHYFGADEATSF